MQRSNTPLSLLQQKAAAALRRYLAGEGDSTEALREVATCLVQSREHFTTTEGIPDWKGNSNAYRQWSRATYDAAGVPRDRLSSVQAAVRYHVSAVVRERLDGETLNHLGLLTVSARERSAQRHATTYDLANLFGQGGPIVDAEQITAALRAMTTTLRRIDLQTAANDNAAVVEQIAPRVHELQARVNALATRCRALNAGVDEEWADIPGLLFDYSPRAVYEEATRAIDHVLKRPTAYSHEQLQGLMSNLQLVVEARATPAERTHVSAHEDVE